jgi:formylglycine-generating enzyme required for sulfatase activity
MTDPFRIFVVWDSAIPQVTSALKPLRRRAPDHGAEVRVLGLDDPAGVPIRLIRSEIEEAHGVLALLDRPNANVGLEIGFALGLGRPVRLMSVGDRPAWCGERAPFEQQLVHPNLMKPEVRQRVLTLRPFEPPGRRPTPGDGTLLLCPHSPLGRTFAEEVGDRWPEPRQHTWTLQDLGPQLDGVARVVWIVPQPDGEDRDGPESARLATLAGYAAAIGLDLFALAQEGPRQVIDAFSWREPFRDVEDLGRRVAELAKLRPGTRSDPWLSLRRDVLLDTRRLTPFTHALEHRDLPGIYVPLGVEGDLRGTTDLRTLLKSGGQWALVAEPGAGKTTTLRHLAHELANEDGPLALHIPLYALALAGKDPFDWLEEGGQPGLAERLRKEAPIGHVWLLLDGLDEVPASHKVPLHARLERMARDLPQMPMVVSGRPIAFEKAPLAGFHEVRLQALSDAQQRQLVERLAPEFAPALMTEIRCRPMLRSLARNPLMLTLVALTGQAALTKGGALPVNRVDLYARAVRLLLDCSANRERQESPEGRVLDVGLALDALQRLAFRLMGEPGQAWKFDRLTRLMLEEWAADEAHARLMRTIWKSPRVLLEDVAATSGLLGCLDGKQGQWRFLHHSLGEYLAAVEAVRRGAVAEWDRAWREDRSGERRGEAYGLLCVLLPAPEAHLRRLKAESDEFVMRALKGMDGVEPGLVVELVPERAWGDELAEVLELTGSRPERLREVLYPLVTRDRSADALGRLWATLEQLGLEPDRTRFFDACGMALPSVPVDTVDVPAGSFWMGSQEGDDDERPCRWVTLTQPFRLGRTPVTNAEYRQLWPKHADGKSADHPVGVRWYEARLYAAWLGGRLPTEAEWEYACRAGTETAFSFGDDEDALVQHGWYDKNSRIKLHPVGEKLPNPWGLRDMHGLMWEWCQDGYAPYEEVPQSDPQGPARGVRCLRGGFFYYPAAWCRSAKRFWNWPWMSNPFFGFRVLLPARRP